MVQITRLVSFYRMIIQKMTDNVMSMQNQEENFYRITVELGEATQEERSRYN
jgi:hypothetical protein